MEDTVKDRFLMILLISNIIFVLLWSGAIGTANRQRKIATDKFALTMDLEEKNAKLEKERASLTNELKDAQTQVAEEKSNHEATKKELSQEKVAQQALKAELERITRLKETLENDLKEALAEKKK